MLHPEVAFRDCRHCQKYFYKEDGTVATEVTVRNGEKVEVPSERTAYGMTPCRTQQGCPKGTPENPVGFTRREEDAYRFYLETKGSGRPMPDEALCRWYSAIIYEAEREVDRARQTQDLVTLLQAMSTVRSGA